MDNLSIQNHLRTLSGIGQLGPKPEIGIPEAPRLGEAPEASGTNFKDMLADSIDRVNQMMNESDQSIKDLATGKSADVHGTLIALQKADISFRMLLEVRNKVMKAYEDVMRMQA